MDILLVGTYTQHDAPAVLEKQELGKGIYLIPYNEILGDVAGTPLIIQMQNPSWVCLMKNRLFAVSESEDAAEIVEYEVGVQEERLTAEKKAGLQMPGKASCHIEKDEKVQRLFVSDYGSGDLKVIDISEAGSPKLLQEISFTGKGLDPERQEASHIHSCFLHRGDLYVADLGCDKIYSFDIDKGKLLQKETIEVRPGAGPYGSTMPVAMNIYQEAFTKYNLGYGSAKSVILFLTVAAVTLIQLYCTRKKEVEY